VARAVSRAVGPVAHQERQPHPATASGKPNPEAYEFYLRGLSHIRRIGEKDLDRGIELLESAVVLDSAFLPAQAGLAAAYGNKSFYYRADDPQWEEKGFAAARKALALDPASPEAHFAQAVMLWRPSHGFPNREALSELRKALAGRPNDDEAWHQHGLILFHAGHLAGGRRSIEKRLRSTLPIRPPGFAWFRFTHISKSMRKHWRHFSEYRLKRSLQTGSITRHGLFCRLAALRRLRP